MAEIHGWIISTSSLGTALFISIIIHIVCFLYCFLKLHLRRSLLIQKYPESLNCSGSGAFTARKSFQTPRMHKSSFMTTNSLYGLNWPSAMSLSNQNDTSPVQPHYYESDSCSNENLSFQHNLNPDPRSGLAFPAQMRDLYQVSERSILHILCSKLIVSVTHLVTSMGDTLYLDNTGISLQIPPGAVESQQGQLISLVLDWDLSDNPYMEESQSLVSPVIYCGPHGAKLKKSCVLTYKHCAYNANHLNVVVSETELLGQKKWKIFENFNSHRNNNKSIENGENNEKTVTITQDECRVNITSFTLYTAIMTIPLEEQPDSRLLRCGKWLQVAVFSYPLHSDGVHHQCRLYFLNKTPCALQWAIQNESKFGGSMCCPEKVFLFNGNHSEDGKDVLVRATYVSENWEPINDTDGSNRVPFLYIWHGKCPYASICFRHKMMTAADADFSQELSIRFFIYQESMQHAGEKLDLQILRLVNPSRSLDDRCENKACMKHGISQISINVSVNKSTDKSKLYKAADKLKCPRIPQDLRLKLRLLLDPPCTFGNNWKFLASAMGLDSRIRYLTTVESPTEELINILEEKMSGLDDLKIYLKDIDRLDAMKEVEDFILKNC